MVNDERFGYGGTDPFSGRIANRHGTFVFQHGGIREAGKLRPFGFIVSGSGTGELSGIRGAVKISVTPEGRHLIELEYDFDK